ncbi:HD domain-containing protein [candidate division WOR-3 bacterium]|nr:HD domain-containing protein [candidate division WOR-3 bacterium]
MNKKYIIKIFPEIKKIESKSLRKGVVNSWLLAMKRGKWKKIDNIPFTLLIKTKKTLINHTRTVTCMAMSIAKERSDMNMDFVITGGLVHDVGKLLEYEKKGKKYVKSSYGKLIRHPVSGYGLVLEAGLPVEVAHIVAAHSVEGEKVERSNEAILIHHCDFIDFDIEKSK